MAADPNREAYLRMVEGQACLDGRFTNVLRIGPSGGDGAFSLVFSADDLVTGRRIALKFFHPDCREPYRLDCFEREERLLHELQGQPDILQWVAPRSQLDISVATGVSGLALNIPFFHYATELASSNLKALIMDDTLDTERKLIALHEMSRAIQRVHRRGIVHRDLKPGNFLVMQNGSLKLGDFGAARHLTNKSRALLSSYARSWPGDSRYTAPEILAGLFEEEPELCYAADLYSLGCIAFELFTGTVLGPQIFDAAFATDLANWMAYVQAGLKRTTYAQFVTNISAGHPLPSVASFGSSVPSSIRDRIDRLYQNLAALDFRNRSTDFRSIFRQIQSCLLVVRNEESFQRWLREKRRRRAAAALRRQP